MRMSLIGQSPWTEPEFGWNFRRLDLKGVVTRDLRAV